MAYIKRFKYNELIGGTDNTDVYPVTSTKAVREGNTNQEEINARQHSRVTVLEGKTQVLEDFKTVVEAYIDGGGGGGSSAGIYYAQ